MNPAQSDAIRESFSQSFEQTFEANKNLHYKLAADNPDAIDCSHLTAKALHAAFQNCGASCSALKTNSEGQIEVIGGQTGQRLQGTGQDFLSGVNAGKLKAGMVLASASGIDRGWNEGRALGIDHVTCIYKDSHSGEMMVLESTSGKSAERDGNGVRRTALAEWLKHNQNKQLFAVDPVDMLDGTATPKINPLLAGTPSTGYVAATQTQTATGPTSKDSFNKEAQSSAFAFTMLVAFVASAMTSGKTTQGAAPETPDVVRPAVDRRQVSALEMPAFSN